MLDKQNARQISQKVFAFSRADEIETTLNAQKDALTRFAGNIIHQNVAEEGQSLFIRTITGKKTGSTSTNLFDDESLTRSVDAAVTITGFQKDDPEFVSLPMKQTYTMIQDPYVQATADFGPMERAQVVVQIVDSCKKRGLDASGAFSTGEWLSAIANSRGVFASQQGTHAGLSLTVSGKNSTGWIDVQDKDIQKIDIQKLTDIAVEKALMSKDPAEVPPGDYTVILEPAAVFEFFAVMAIMGFNAQSYQDGRSFLVGKMGSRIAGENITLTDDAYDPRIDGSYFDSEGMPKKKVVLIKNGKAESLVYDRKTAQKDHVETTGHALPRQWGPVGPMPVHMIVQGGNSTLEEMIATTDRGIYVTHFNYTNIVDPMKMIMTGMTRDGTFLVENGKIKSGVKNLRFTESILETLSNVESISKEQVRRSSFINMLVPAMKINHFTFSSGTEY
jgi:PmbA protein